MFIKIALTLILTGILSYIFTRISTTIGYDYGSKKKELISILISVSYVAILSYFARTAHSTFTIKGEIYFSLFIIASIASISSSFIDLEYQEIPDSYNAFTAILGIVSVLVLPSLFNTAILTGGIMFGIYFVIMLLTNAMGGGDVKMAGALGLLVPISTLKYFLISPFAFGTVIALYLIFIKKQDKNNKIPFGPYITMGFLLTTYMYWAI